MLWGSPFLPCAAEEEEEEEEVSQKALQDDQQPSLLTIFPSTQQEHFDVQEGEVMLPPALPARPDPLKHRSCAAHLFWV